MKDNKSRFLRGSVTSYLQMFTSILINILLVRIMLDGLGKSSYGLWVTISSLFGFMVLSDLGIGQSATKLISEKEDQFAKNDFIDKELVSTTFFTNLFIGLIILIVNVAISIYIYKILNISNEQRASVSYLYILLSINFFITFIFSTFRNVLIGYKYISTNNLLGIAKNILNFILIYFVLKVYKSLYSIAIVQIVLSLIFGILSVYAIKLKKINIYIKLKYFSLKTFRLIFKPGVYYLILQLSGILANNTDNLVLNYFLSSAVVALYSTGFKLTTVLMQLIFTIVDNLFPFISELDGRNDKSRIKKIFIMSEKYTIYIGVFFTFTLSIFGKSIMQIWIGKNNALSASTMALFGILLFLNIANHVPVVFLQGMYKHLVIAKIAIIEAIVNVILSIAFVKYFGLGANGVLLGTIVADIFMMFWFSTFSIIKHLKVNIKEFWNILKPSVIFTVFLAIIQYLINYFNITFSNNLFGFVLQYCVFTLIIIAFSYFNGIFNFKIVNKKIVIS